MNRFFVAWTVALATTGIVVVACVGSDPETTPTTAADAATPDAEIDSPSPPADASCGGKTCTNDAGVTFACIDGRCGNEVVQVASGITNACVLILDGTVWCWGDRRSGLAGSVDSSSTPTPTKYPGIEGVAEIALGSGFAVARMKDGTVRTFGDGTKSITLPAKAVQVVATHAQACARTEGGAVLCWGISQSASLGVPPFSDGGILVTNDAQAIPGLEADVVDVAIGNGRQNGDPELGSQAVGCAVKKGGSVSCWGSNVFGALGHQPASDGDISCEQPLAAAKPPCNPNALPVKDATDAGAGGFVKVQVGDVAACALKADGSVWCWGQNRLGNLGVTADGTGRTYAALVAGLNTTKILNVGWNSAHAVDQDGHTKTWGIDEFGELGLGSFQGESCTAGGATCQPTPASSAFLDGVRQISLAHRTALAIASDGQVVAWGNNDFAQLGHAAGTNGDVACPSAPSRWCNTHPTKVAGLP